MLSSATHSLGECMNDATLLLTAMEQGDPTAADKLLELLYEELRRLAASKMEQWAELRMTRDAALAVIGDGDGQPSLASATVDLTEFARRHGLKLICEGCSGEDDNQTFLEFGSNEPNSLAVPPQSRMAQRSRSISRNRI